jgi:hypothetical protein
MARIVHGAELADFGRAHVRVGGHRNPAVGIISGKAPPLYIPAPLNPTPDDLRRLAPGLVAQLLEVDPRHLHVAWRVDAVKERPGEALVRSPPEGSSPEGAGSG